jgi:2-oxoglutarate ferredoxin oxidoreductase subunit beta
VSTAAPSAPPKKLNILHLDMSAYRGGKSTLCAGCGHNAVTERVTEAFWEMGIEPWQVMKFSGIGCAAKTPAYFLSSSHGINAVHGRAPTVATGAIVANPTLPSIVVTGDGDTASIGIGHFVHMLRRNLPLIYVIENNGV